ncbi:hypothetical protein ACRRTK_019181 [Alexandromys fortis]
MASTCLPADFDCRRSGHSFQDVRSSVLISSFVYGFGSSSSASEAFSTPGHRRRRNSRHAKQITKICPPAFCESPGYIFTEVVIQERGGWRKRPLALPASTAATAEPRQARRCVSVGNAVFPLAQAPDATSETEPGKHPEAPAAERGHPAFPKTLARRRGRGLQGRNRGAPPISERRTASAGPRSCDWHGRSLPGDVSEQQGRRKPTTGDTVRCRFRKPTSTAQPSARSPTGKRRQAALPRPRRGARWDLRAAFPEVCVASCPCSR